MKQTRVPYLSSRLSERVHRLIDAELRRAGAEGIQGCHGDVLAALFANGDGLSGTDLVKMTHRTKSTVTVLVDRLEKTGFVERRKDETDRRSTRVWLTEKGKAFEPVFRSIGDRVTLLVNENLTEQEAETLERLLSKAAGIEKVSL